MWTLFKFVAGAFFTGFGSGACFLLGAKALNWLGTGLLTLPDPNLVGASVVIAVIAGFGGGLVLSDISK